MWALRGGVARRTFSSSSSLPDTLDLRTVGYIRRSVVNHEGWFVQLFPSVQKQKGLCQITWPGIAASPSPHTHQLGTASPESCLPELWPRCDHKLFSASHKATQNELEFQQDPECHSF